MRLLGLLALLLTCVAPAHADSLTTTRSPLAPQSPADIAARKTWVDQVEAQDFYFWRRWFVFGGPGNGEQFDKPDAWYQPSAVVIGGLRPFFPMATSREQTIAPAALQEAADWAFARRTVAFYVVHKGKVQFSRFAPGMDDAGMIGGHSMTKTLAGILMGFAIHDGKVKSLDEPAETYLTEWKGDPRGRITLRQLLQNVSGLEVPPGVNIPDNKGVQLIDGDQVNRTALSYDLVAPPGTQFAHNNVTTQLIALIIERATGVKYNVYLSEKLWRPVGNVRAALRLDRLGGDVVAFCCSQTSPSDWVRIGHLLMHDGVLPDGTPVLPAGWVAEMRKGSAVYPNYGLQIWNGAPYTPRRPYLPNVPNAPANIHSEPFAADDLFFLDGGAKMRVWMVPSLDLVVARFGSQPDQTFDEAFLPNTIIRGIRKR